MFKIIWQKKSHQFQKTGIFCIFCYLCKIGLLQLSLHRHPRFFVTKLHVQNAAAKIVLNWKNYNSVTPYLMKLYWLPAKKDIIYKLKLIVFKALSGEAPDCMQYVLSINQPPRPLCYGDKMKN